MSVRSMKCSAVTTAYTTPWKLPSCASRRRASMVHLAFVTRLIELYTGATYGLDACGYACSDHASWHRIGVPVSMPFESRMRDRNKKIHTRDDTLETSGNNADHALKFARLAAAYAIELGKGQLGD